VIALPGTSGDRSSCPGRCAAGVLLVLPVLILLAAFVAGCGGSSSSGVALYLGDWQRVDGGEPDPAFTLKVVQQGDGAAVTFANQTNGMSQTVVGKPGDGFLACTLANGDAAAAGAASPAGASGVPAESDLQLSVDAGGQLVVDLVLSDGTLEPVWIYDRAPVSGATTEP
jgi:hypothetical protein